MPRHSKPTGPPPPYPSQDNWTGIVISISEREPGATILSGSTATPRMRPRWRSAWMTTGGSSTRLSSTSISPRASSQTPSSSGRRSPPLSREAVAHSHPHSPMTSTGASCFQPSAVMRHQSPSSGLPQSTLRPPRLGLRTTMRPQDAGNPYNRPGTSTVVPLFQVVMLIDSSGFAQSFATAYVSGSSVLRLVNGAVQVVPNPHVR